MNQLINSEVAWKKLMNWFLKITASEILPQKIHSQTCYLETYVLKIGKDILKIVSSKRYSYNDS